jgi:hypothetical protein
MGAKKNVENGEISEACFLTASQQGLSTLVVLAPVSGGRSDGMGRRWVHKADPGKQRRKMYVRAHCSRVG